MRKGPMIPQPESGKVQIDGRRWSWQTVGHICGSKSIRWSGVRWTITFSDSDDFGTRYWCEMADTTPDELTESSLRELFGKARTNSTRRS